MIKENNDPNQPRCLSTDKEDDLLEQGMEKYYENKEEGGK